MPTVLIDTNIWIAALIGKSPDSAAAAVVKKALSREWQAVFSTATFLEVAEVFLEREFQALHAAAEELIAAIVEAAIWQQPKPAPIILGDSGDQKWLNLLHGSKADGLVTKNIRDFAAAKVAGYPIKTAPEALRLWG